MGKGSRSPMQVAPEFKKRLDEIQKKIMMSRGVKKSLRDLTNDIIRSPSFIDIEKQLIKSQKYRDCDIKIKFDQRIVI